MSNRARISSDRSKIVVDGDTQVFLYASENPSRDDSSALGPLPPGVYGRFERGKEEDYRVASVTEEQLRSTISGARIRLYDLLVEHVDGVNPSSTVNELLNLVDTCLSVKKSETQRAEMWAEDYHGQKAMVVDLQNQLKLAQERLEIAQAEHRTADQYGSAQSKRVASILGAFYAKLKGTAYEVPQDGDCVTATLNYIDTLNIQLAAEKKARVEDDELRQHAMQSLTDDVHRLDNLATGFATERDDARRTLKATESLLCSASAEAGELRERVKITEAALSDLLQRSFEFDQIRALLTNAQFGAKNLLSGGAVTLNQLVVERHD